MNEQTNAGDFPATMGLVLIVQNLPEKVNKFEAIAAFKKVIDFYKAQYTEGIKNNTDPYSLLNGFYELIDENAKGIAPEIKSRISCVKGCAHCCHQFVAVSDQEAALIVEACKQDEINIDYRYLEKQASYTPENFAQKPHTACVFLDKDNTCKIYDVRPFACRKYLVVTKPKFCNAKVYPKRQVLTVSDANAECIASAFIDNPVLSLPQALLKLNL